MDNFEKFITFVILFQFVARILRGLFKSSGYEQVADEHATSQNPSHADESNSHQSIDPFMDRIKQELELAEDSYDHDLSMQHKEQLQQEIAHTQKLFNPVHFHQKNTPHFVTLNRITKEIQIQLKDLYADLSFDGKEALERTQIREIRQAYTELDHACGELISYYQLVTDYGKEYHLAHKITDYMLKPLYDFAYAEGLTINSKIIIHTRQHWSLLAREKIQACYVDVEQINELDLWPMSVRNVSGCLDMLYPAWARERRQILKPRYARAPSTNRRTLKWQVQDSLGWWSDLLWSDLFMIYRWGPDAADILMQELLDLYEDEDDLLAVKPNYHNPQQLGHDAPVIIRLHVVASLLATMGYIQESQLYTQSIQKHLGSHIHVYISVYQHIEFPMESIRTEIDDWVEHFTQIQWTCWSQRCLSDIPYFTLSIAEWKHINEQAQQWLTQHKLTDPHWLYPTLFHLACHYPSQSPTLVRWLQEQNIYKENTAVVHKNTRKDDLIAAILLPDLLLKRPRRPQKNHLDPLIYK